MNKQTETEKLQNPRRLAATVPSCFAHTAMPIVTSSSSLFPLIGQEWVMGTQTTRRGGLMFVTNWTLFHPSWCIEVLQEPKQFGQQHTVTVSMHQDTRYSALTLNGRCVWFIPTYNLPVFMLTNATCSSLLTWINRRVHLKRMRSRRVCSIQVEVAFNSVKPPWFNVSKPERIIISLYSKLTSVIHTVSLTSCIDTSFQGSFTMYCWASTHLQAALRMHPKWPTIPFIVQGPCSI